jgi:hypothetical protein
VWRGWGGRVSWLRVQKGWCAAQHPTHHFSFSPVLGQSCHFCLSLESARNGERDTGERGKWEGERENARARDQALWERRCTPYFVTLGWGFFSVFFYRNNCINFLYKLELFVFHNTDTFCLLPYYLSLYPL